jgi:hypothetical protein|nr:MAG TPA: hypothetical protein [Caudoviricetes sp.]
MATGQLSIDFHPVGQEEIDIKKNDPNYSDGSLLRFFFKTPDDFLTHSDYTAPKYSIWTNGIMSCDAKKTVAGSEKPLYLKINDQDIGQEDIGKSYKSISKNFTNTKIVITNLKQGVNKGYLTLTGNATWSCTVNMSTDQLYLKHPKIVLNYTCPKFTINVNTDNSAMGTVTCANGSSSMEFDVTAKGQTQETTITATPNDGYFFIKWSDGNKEPSRKIVLEEANLTSNNTQLTYIAIFGKKEELYVGSKRVDAIYIGTKKAQVYCGSTRIL